MKPIIKLKVGWEQALKKALTPHSRICKCGCKQERKTYTSRIRELSKMVARGEAVVI